MKVRVTSPRERAMLMSAMADEYERRIMSAAAPQDKTTDQLSRECQIPLGSCHRKINAMVEKGVLVVAKITITLDGKKSVFYRTPFERITFNFADSEISISAEVNKELYDKFVAKQYALTDNRL